MKEKIDKKITLEEYLHRFEKDSINENDVNDLYNILLGLNKVLIEYEEKRNKDVEKFIRFVFILVISFLFGFINPFTGFLVFFVLLLIK